MDNGKSKLEKKSDGELVNNMLANNIYTGHEMEMMRRLKESIQSFNINSSKQSKKMQTLSIAMFCLGIGMIFIGIVQIVLTIISQCQS